MNEENAFEYCPSCGAPLLFVSNHRWMKGGVTVQSLDPDHRMVLIEVDNLDLLFRKIEDLLTVPIERIIIETKRRATRDYIDRLTPPEVKEGVRKKEIPVEPLIQANNAISVVMGYGKPVLEGYRLEYDDEDHLTQVVINPYSVPLWCGDMTGAVESVTSRDNDVVYKSLAEDRVWIKVFPSEHPPQFRERLQTKKFPYREVDYALETCEGCGGPAELSWFSWETKGGTIKDKNTGRRVCMVGPAYLEAVFDEMEREIGEEIPRTIVEAQRQFVKEGGIYSPSDIGTLDEFRRLLAVRGLGYLEEFQVKHDGLFMRLINPALHLLMVGLLQGYYEVLFDLPSSVASWSLDGPVMELEIKER